MFMPTAIIKGLPWLGAVKSEFEGKFYYGVQVNGGFVNPKFRINEEQYMKWNTIPEGTLVDIEVKVMYDNKQGCLISTKEILNIAYTEKDKK